MGTGGYGRVVQPAKMMSIRSDEERAVYDRWVKIQSEVLMPMGRRGERDAIIATAEDMLAGETNPAFRQLLIMGVSATLHVHGWDEESLAWCERRVAEAPDDPHAHNGLAMWYFVNSQPERSPGDLEKALEYSAEAAAKARASGSWRRSVLHDRCRIAVAARRYDIVAEAMEEILQVWANPCEPDIPAFETDWLDAIPAHAVEADLLERYRAAAG